MKATNIYPVFAFSLGSGLIGLGACWLWFSRHRPIFLIVGTIMFIGGWLTIAFADAMQSELARLAPLLALLLALPDRFGLGP